jgi:hypothetical protein
MAAVPLRAPVGAALCSPRMRRLIPGTLSTLLGAVAAHAATGLLVHVGQHAASEDVHRVHGPIAVIALTALVWRTARRRQAPRPHRARVGELLARLGLLSAFLVAETLLAEGSLVGVVHDPWILLAPVGVVVAHLATAAAVRVAEVAVAWVLPAEPTFRVDLGIDGWTAFAEVLGSRAAGAVRGRAPPLRLG